MISAPSAHSRILGCLLAGAVGDALGGAIEFDSWSAIERRFGPAGLTEYAPAYGRIGAITDDTQMTLFTAEGVLCNNARGLEQGTAHPPTTVWHAYLRWMVTQGWPDALDHAPSGAGAGWLIEEEVLHASRAPGLTCISALASGRMGTLDDRLNDSKGCGGVMRVAPAGLAYDGAHAFRLGAEFAAITHSHPSGYLSAGVLTMVVASLVRGEQLPRAIDTARAELMQYEDHLETLDAIDAAVALAGDGVPSPEELESLGGGWVGEEALAIALCCALVARDLRHGLLLAVNHSGDSDSTGAIAGNLLGAIHGIEGIPDDLLAPLEAREIIEQIANDLADVFVDGAEPSLDRYPPY